MLSTRSPATRARLKFVASALFAVLTVGASLLVARRLTDSTWPLQHVSPWLCAAAAAAYLASFVLRARAWHRLFPRNECPDQANCLASVGAAAASGAVLPFRLDYFVKVGMLRKLGGIRVGLGDRGLRGVVRAAAREPRARGDEPTDDPKAARPRKRPHRPHD